MELVSISMLDIALKFRFETKILKEDINIHRYMESNLKVHLSAFNINHKLARLQRSGKEKADIRDVVAKLSR